MADDKILYFSETGQIKQSSTLDRLRAISGTNQLDALRAMVKRTDHVIPDLVPRGSLALFYALPNAGKTLFVLEMLRRQIQAGAILGEYVFYLNEDDNLSGFTKKSELVAPLHMSMISTVKSSDENLRSASDLLKLFDEMAQEDCSKVVIVLDTLKKFVSVMSKDLVPQLFTLLRRLTSAGATVIILGHANKNKADDGKIMFAGVQDIQDDIDVMFSIESLSDRNDPIQRGLIECKKDRGPVEQELAFEYRKSSLDTYDQMLRSLKIVSDSEGFKRQRALRSVVAKYEAAVDFLSCHLSGGMERPYTELVALLGAGSKNPQGLTKKQMDTACKALSKAGWLSERKDRKSHNSLHYRLKGENHDC